MKGQTHCSPFVYYAQQTQDVKTMLAQRLRRWPNIGSTSYACWVTSTYDPALDVA